MAIKPITRYGKFTPTGVDRSAETRMRALAGLGEQLQEMAVGTAKRVKEAEAPKEAVRAAEEARKVDPETGEVTYAEVKERSAFKYGSAQYNQKLFSTMRSQREQDSRARIKELQETYKDDPLGFENEASSYLDGLLEGAPEEMRPTIRQDVSGRILTAQTAINNAYDVKQRNTAIAEHQGNINDGVAEMTRLIVNGEDATVEYNSAIESIKALAEVDESYDYEQAVTNLNKKRDETARTKKLLDTAETDVSQAYKDLLDLEDKIPSNYSADEWAKYLENTRKRINVKKSVIENAKIVDKQAEKEFADGVTAQVAMGQDYNEEDLEKALKIYEGTDAKKNLEDAVQIHEYKQSSFNERIKLREQAKNLGVQGAEVLAKMVQAENQLNTALLQDPMGYAFTQKSSGVVRSDFNVLNPTKETLEQRKANAKLASQHYTNGQKNFPILTSSEADEFIQGFALMTANEQSDLAQVYGADSYIWGLLSDKNQGVYAQAGSHPSKNVSQKIFDGLEAIKADPAQVSGKDFTKTFETYFYNYIGEGTVPYQDEADLFDAAVAFYASTVPQGTRIINTKKTSEAIKSVIGEVIDYNGYKTILPTGVTEDQFEEYWDNVTLNTIANIMPNDTESRQKQVLRFFQSGDVRMQQVAGGQYIARLGDQVVVHDINGNPVYFNIDPFESQARFELRQQEASKKQATKAESLKRLKEFKETEIGVAL